MTIEEYNEKMDEYAERLYELYNNEYDDEYDLLYEEVSRFQEDYMKNVLVEYQKTIDCKARDFIYDLLCHAVIISETGNSIVDVETEEMANEIENII